MLVFYRKKTLTISKAEQDLGEFLLLADNSLEEVIISGNLKPVNRLESTIPVEVYSPEFYNKTPLLVSLKAFNTSTESGHKSTVLFAIRGTFTLTA